MMICKNLTLLALLAVALLMVGCSKVPSVVGVADDSEKVSYLKEDWGVVKSLEFSHSGKHSAYFKVTTDKVVFNELDITDFPDGKIVVGDTIFYQTKLTKDEVNTSYCKNDLCQASGTCYWWMPCFNKYEQSVPQ